MVKPTDSVYPKGDASTHYLSILENTRRKYEKEKAF